MNLRIYLIIMIFISSAAAVATDTNQAEVVIGSDVFQLEVVCKEEAKVLGLSGRKSLDEKQGMLFIFARPDRHGIWMKAMNFPLDIIWLDVFRAVNHIERKVMPETYPEIFSPPHPALYVLEIPANAGRNIELEMTASFTGIPSRCF